MHRKNKVQRIVPAMMLYEDIRDKLDNDNILRPIAKNSDEIWQQMRWENFDKMLANKSLYMKAHSEYSDYDERKIQDYIKTCYKTENVNDNDLQKMLTEYENQMYISCWYSSSNLSDVVFKQYADNGIAIGTDVGTFIECVNSTIQQSDSDAKDYKYFAGNVQYIYHKELTKDNIFENTQIICPIFLKGMQFKADNEFRLCVFKDNADSTNEYNKNINSYNKDIYDSVGKLTTYNIKNADTCNLSNILSTTYNMLENIYTKPNTKALHLNSIDLKKLIKRVALKDYSIYSVLENSIIIELINKKVNEIGLKARDNIKRTDGFIILELEEN